MTSRHPSSFCSQAKRFCFFFVLFCLFLPSLQAQKRDYADGPLTWDDFKGDVPDNTQFAAALAGGIELENATKDATKSKGSDGVPPNDCIICTKCKPRKAGHKAFKINKKKKKCRVKVKAFIDQGRSWTKPAQQTKELLAHEQGHADIWEVAARAAEKEINCTEKCLKATNCSFGGKNAFRAAINAIVADSQAKGQAMQLAYDLQTDHGRKKPKQEEWEKKLRRLLAIPGGPSWDDFSGSGSTGQTGGTRIYVGEHNDPIVPIYFPQLVFSNIPWSDQALAFVLPSLTFEEHGTGQSRIWALSAAPVVNIYDQDNNLVASANISAFFGDENDQVFTAELYGVTGPRPISDEQPFPVDPELEIAEDPRVEDDTPVFTQLTLTFPQPLGEMLEGLGPYETFACTFSVGEAAHEPGAADVNYDGAVTQADVEELQLILEGIGVAILPQTGDLNGDGDITDEDLQILQDMIDAGGVVTVLPIDLDP